MRKMKVSFITTFLNEEKTVTKLLESLCKQSRLPDEIILLDGGSKDNTLKKVSHIKFAIPQKNIKIIKKKGNRSIGRNEAITQATGNIIVCSDSGNILDKNWVKNIIKPFSKKDVDVVAGYYTGLAENVFQKCLIPYVLVMPDRLDPKTFLPATRSVAFKKSIWEKVGKFDENLSHNEDYVFARKLKAYGAKIVFVKSAIVHWIPRNNLKQTYVMFYRFAYGDMEAGVIRPKVVLLFLRYFLLIGTLIYYLVSGKPYVLIAVFLLVIVYIFWSIAKNYKYVNDPKAFIILPLLQITADLSVLEGSTCALANKFSKHWNASAKDKKDIPLWQHTLVILVGIICSVGIYLFLLNIFKPHFSMPQTTAISWYTIHHYPRQQDIFYFVTAFITITLLTCLLWGLWILQKSKQ